MKGPAEEAVEPHRLTVGLEFTHLARTRVLENGEEIADAGHPSFRVTNLTPEAIYALPGRFSIGARLPVEFLRFGAAGSTQAEEKGVGDLQAFGAWDLLGLQGRLRTALGFGLSLPTGRTHPQPVEENTGAVLQLGSGTIDPLLFGRVAYRFEFPVVPYASVATRIPFYENRYDYRAGASASYAAGAQGPLLFSLFGPDLEVEARQRTRVSQDGQPLDQTGGVAVFIVPRLRVLPLDDFRIDTWLAIPLLERVNERQLGADFEFAVGLSYAFGPFVKENGAQE